MNVLTPATQTHGRVLVGGRADATTSLVVFHGYAQSADDAFADAESIATAVDAQLIAIQGLHRFYSRRHERVVASWMTRDDRELAIADNVAYIDTCLDQTASRAERVIVLGFSQGASMAYRAAQLCRRTPDAVIAIAGDVPPELSATHPRPWPRILLAAGTTDPHFPPERQLAEASALRRAGGHVDLVTYEGGHEWTDALRQAIADWIARGR